MWYARTGHALFVGMLCLVSPSKSGGASAEVEAMTDQLRSLLANPSILLSRRTEVARFAHSAWDWDHCADQYLQRFQQLLESSEDDLNASVIGEDRAQQSHPAADSALDAASSAATAPFRPTSAWPRWSSATVGFLPFAVLLWWQRAAFSSLDWATVRPRPLGASGLRLLGGFLAMSGRTWLLVRMAAPQASFPEVVRITFYGMLSSYTFLGMFGGLGILSWYLVHRCGIAPWRAGTRGNRPADRVRDDDAPLRSGGHLATPGGELAL